MSDNTISTARYLGSLSIVRTFNDFVGSTDPKDYYRFSLDSKSNFNLNISGSYYGIDVYRDANNNGVIDSGEKLISVSPNGSSGLSTSYTINMNASLGSITGQDGMDLLANIERLQFADRIINLVPPPSSLI